MREWATRVRREGQRESKGYKCICVSSSRLPLSVFVSISVSFSFSVSVSVSRRRRRRRRRRWRRAHTSDRCSTARGGRSGELLHFSGRLQPPQHFLRGGEEERGPVAGRDGGTHRQVRARSECELRVIVRYCVVVVVVVFGGCCCSSCRRGCPQRAARCPPAGHRLLPLPQRLRESGEAARGRARDRRAALPRWWVGG